MEEDHRRGSPPREEGDVRNRQARFYPGGRRQGSGISDDAWEEEESAWSRERYGSGAERRDGRDELPPREARHASRDDRPGRREQSWQDRDRNIMDRVVREVRSWFNDDDPDYVRDYDRNYPDYGSDYARAYTGRDYGRDDERERGGREDRYGGSNPYRTSRGERGRGSAGSDSRGSQRQGDSPGGTAFVYSEFWLVPGPHRGVGPKGYRRSKERIREEICERLAQHGRLDASDIEIDVDDDGEVRLSGTVESREIKRMAEDVAESVSGVHDVQNQIRVRRGGSADPARADREQSEPAYQEGTTGSTARTEPAAQKQNRTDH